MSSTSTESEIVTRATVTPEPHQNTNVDSLLSIPSNYSTPRKRHLYRKVIDLSQKNQEKKSYLKTFKRLKPYIKA